MMRVTGTALETIRGKKWSQERARAEDLFDHAARYRQSKRENKWLQSERQYEGQHFAVGEDDWSDDDMDRITVNMSFSTVSTMVPYVTGEEPSFFIEPYLAPATKRGAVALQAWLNRNWRHHGVNGQEHLEVATTDALMYGDGWLQTMWDIEEIVSDEGGLPGMAETRGKIWVEQVSPWHVWLDPEADGLQDARYVIVRNRVPLATIKADSKYSNTGTLGPDAGSFNDSTERVRQLETEHEEDQIVDLLEFYDLDQKRLIVFVKGHDLPLRVIEGIYCPLSHLKNYRIPKCPYGMSELEQIWPLQQELNKARSQMVTHRKRNVSKYVARKGALGTGAEDALRSETVNEIIWVEGNQELDELIKPMDMAQMSADPYQVSDIVTRDIYEISGVNEYLRGATPPTARTATEASIIEGASNIKSTFKLRQVERFVRKVGQYMLDAASDIFPQTPAQEFAMVLTGREAQRVARAEQDPDPNTVMEGSLILSEDLFHGEYEVFVETGSTEMRSPRFREEKYKDMVMTLAQVAPLLQQLGQPIPNIAKVMELWLEASGIEDLEAVLGPEPQQMMQQMQQMGQPGAEQAGAVPAGLPPELAGMMGGGSMPTGPQPGAPNQGNTAPPAAPVSEENSGIIAPA